MIIYNKGNTMQYIPVDKLYSKPYWRGLRLCLFCIDITLTTSKYMAKI